MHPRCNAITHARTQTRGRARTHTRYGPRDGDRIDDSDVRPDPAAAAAAYAGPCPKLSAVEAGRPRLAG